MVWNMCQCPRCDKMFMVKEKDAVDIVGCPFCFNGDSDDIADRAEQLESVGDMFYEFAKKLRNNVILDEGENDEDKTRICEQFIQ